MGQAHLARSTHHGGRFAVGPSGHVRRVHARLAFGGPMFLAEDVAPERDTLSLPATLVAALIDLTQEIAALTGREDLHRAACSGVRRLLGPDAGRAHVDAAGTLV